MRIVNIFKEYKYLIGLLVVGFLIRIIAISQFPPSLNWDEISHGYNAYSILKTGKDEWGVSFPTIFRAYGDYKLPVYIYATVFPVALFGLNEFSVRITSVIAGTLLILFSYLIATSFFNKKIGLLSALFVTIEPWSFFLSRGAFEANLATALIAGGIYFFLQGLKSSKFLIISSLLFSLSVWTYNSARVFAPLLIFSILFIYRGELALIWQKQKKIILVCLAILCLFFIPMFYQLLRPEGQARFSNVSILNEGAIAYIEQQQNAYPGSKLLVNRYTYFIFEVAKNWVSHYSPEFLFTKGGTNYQFSVPNLGLLYLLGLPFLLLGSLVVLKKWKQYTLLIVWVLLAPIAGSLTRDVPHVLREEVLLPLPMIITALGIYTFFSFPPIAKYFSYKVKFNMGILLITILLLTSSIFYFRNYFFSYPSSYSWVWQYGYKDVAQYAKDHYNEYDQIIMTKKYGEPHEFILFYFPWDPQKYRNDPQLERYAQSNWFWVDRFDKFYFVNDWDIPKVQEDKWITERDEQISTNKKTLLITSPGTYPPGWQKIETISFIDGSPAFDILKNK